MEQFIQASIDGLAAGSIYAALALALVLIFRSTGIINFAQGEMAMFTTFIGWAMIEAGVPIAVGLLAAIVAGFLLGIGVHRVLIRRFEGGDELVLVIITVGLFILFNNLAGWIWGFQIRALPSAFGEGQLELGGVVVSVESLGIVSVLLVVVGLLYLVFQRTEIGLAMRATAQNPEMSRLVGIRVGRILTLGWGLAAALGAVAGVLVAPKLFLDVNLMSNVIIFAFAAAALGGFDSPLGAVIGGWLIGISEALAGTYVAFIGGDLKVLVPLFMIFLVLLIRPTGLFGSRAILRA